MDQWERDDVKAYESFFELLWVFGVQVSRSEHGLHLHFSPRLVLRQRAQQIPWSG